MKRILFIGAAIGVVLMTSLTAQLKLLRPSGPHPVGRTALRWVDPLRQEAITSAADDRREVIAEVWYPAEPDTGSRALYFPDLPRVAQALRNSGEVSPIEAGGLRFVRSNSFQQADMAQAERAYPLVILSPGNATNVEFYSSLAEELASHGYIVAGLNHPYDVAAVALSDGSAAQYAADWWPEEMQGRQAAVQERIRVRVEDALFLLDRLVELNASAGSVFSGRLDFSRVGMMGHSLGGITAAEACQADRRLKACLNLDGLQAGGPFSASPDPVLPAQPFMMITKEAQLPEQVIDLFESIPAGSYQVVIAGASHDSFTDGPLLVPGLLPLPNQADRNTGLIRSYMLAFFDQSLKGAPSSLLAGPSQSPEVMLEVFPPD